MLTKTHAKSKRLVFISHGGADTWVAHQVEAHAKRRGAVCFLDDSDTEVGVDFEGTIQDFLDRADELVVLLTPWSMTRPYVWAEIGAAWGRRIPIIALLHGVTIEELIADPKIPILLKRTNMISLNYIDKYLKQLAKRVKSGRK